MYILFRLPTGSGGMAAHHVNHVLNLELEKWAKQQNITYKKKIVKYMVRVTFDRDSDYTVFAMTWQPPDRYQDWLEYEFVEPMSIDRI